MSIDMWLTGTFPSVETIPKDFVPRQYRRHDGYLSTIPVEAETDLTQLNNIITIGSFLIRFLIIKSLSCYKRWIAVSRIHRRGECVSSRLILSQSSFTIQFSTQQRKNHNNV